MAYLTKGLWIRFDDERAGREREMNFYFEGGVASFVRHVNKGRNTLNPRPIYIEKTVDDDAASKSRSSTTTASRGRVQLRQHASTRSTAARTSPASARR